MIGVIANTADHSAVREFFELFKTPWEFYRRGERYEVLLSASGQVISGVANLVLVYGGEKTPFDAESGVKVGSEYKDTIVSYRGIRIPIYGSCITFRSEGSRRITEETSKESITYANRSNGEMRVRIGYDLFRQIRFLLTVGQPLACARMPALEMHIALLRDVIVGCSIPLVEIPPTPEGHGFMVCLTHDVDHPSLRHHKCDHTMFGFLYRAVVGSLINVVRGRMSVRQLFTNWSAALMLPFVHLRLAKDSWYAFDRYLEIEKGLGSTFFVIPCKDNPGRRADRPAPAWRAARYDPSDIEDHIQKFVSSGNEVGTHGIDAWIDSSEGRKERERISRFTKASEMGVRMHWLYFDERSPVALERAGFSYDSTFGYNETVGYRAGTMQVFKPLNAATLLELPLNVMDTALFRSSHLNLSPQEAKDMVGGIVNDAARFGGALTVNWHDRSIAPERLWDEFYVELIDEMKSRGAWFPTAAQAVSWFRKRRSAVFRTVRRENGALRISASTDTHDESPGLRIRVYHPESERSTDWGSEARPVRFMDLILNKTLDICVPIANEAATSEQPTRNWSQRILRPQQATAGLNHRHIER